VGRAMQSVSRSSLTNLQERNNSSQQSGIKYTNTEISPSLVVVLFEKVYRLALRRLFYEHEHKD
jgi:hypothetical protein